METEVPLYYECFNEASSVIALTERHTDSRDSRQEVSTGVQQIPAEDIGDWVAHSRNEDQLRQLHGRWATLSHTTVGRDHS